MTFAANEAASFQCKLDRGAYAPCTSPKTYKRLPKGRHTISVFGTDSLGNADATPATQAFKVK